MIVTNKFDAAVEGFKNEYREMLLSFEWGTVDDALGSYLRTEVQTIAPEINEDGILAHLESGFVRLFNRKALVPVRPLSTEGKRQLFDLIGHDAEQHLGATAKQEEASSAIDNVIADFNGKISIGDFKKKCQTNPAYFALYEQAVASGRV
jgi:hypothetical protein